MSCSIGCCETQAAHWKSIGFATRALVQVNQREQRLARDMTSYKAMVDQGLEPCVMDGAYALERDAINVDQIEGKLPWSPPPT